MRVICSILVQDELLSNNKIIFIRWKIEDREKENNDRNRNIV